MNGRLIGWASSEQYKMRTSDGVLETSGGTSVDPVRVSDTQSIVLADASAVPSFIFLPPPSNQNKSATVTVARQAGADAISVRFLSQTGAQTEALGVNPASSLTLISTGEYWKVISAVNI